MNGLRRRGISFGTVFMLLLTIAVVGGCAVIFPRLTGKMDKRIDAQELVNAISGSLDLPPLSLSDIPLFPQPRTTEAPGVAAPGYPVESPPGVMEQNVTSAPVSTPAPARKTFTLAAGGTVAFDADIRKSAYHSESKTYDYTAPFEYIRPVFDADISLATMENTIVDNGKLNDINVTADVLKGLSAAGLDMLALGHEHVLDLGFKGLSETVASVRKAGFTVLGAVTDRGEEQSAILMDLSGVQVAFLHYADVISSAGKRAIKAEDCAYALPAYEAGRVAADIQAVRAKGAQVVIVLIHWGSDNQTKLTQAQQEKAQAIADAGADILLGAHNEVVLPIVYLTGNRPDGTKRPTLVCYSLGALLTGSRESANIAGMLLHLKISYDPAAGMVSFDQVQYTPTYVWRYREDGSYIYQITAGDQAPPAQMDEGQREVMVRAKDRIDKQLADSPAKPRDSGN